MENHKKYKLKKKINNFQMTSRDGAIGFEPNSKFFNNDHTELGSIDF